MQSTINERVASLIEAVGKNNGSFARSIDKGYTSIESIVKGKTKPSFDLLEAVFKTYPSINPIWLLTGDGQMFKSDQTEEKADQYLQTHLTRLEENFASLLEQLRIKDHQLETKDDQIASLHETQKSLQEMLKMVLGKHKDATHEPLSPTEFTAAVRALQKQGINKVRKQPARNTLVAKSVASR